MTSHKSIHFLAALDLLWRSGYKDKPWTKEDTDRNEAAIKLMALWLAHGATVIVRETENGPEISATKPVIGG